ncbi:MAG: D-alanyl-D-alanine endopeptidase [Proteobacteria bacterium]|nr:D-alanyl-D-alanine endopeptidase [Pseudomonadota bacterium]
MPRNLPATRALLGSLIGLTLLCTSLPASGAAPHHRHRVSGIRSVPALRSSSALVVDENTATVLLAKNADAVIPIASITKLMTALVVLDAKQPTEELIKLTTADRQVGRGGHSRLQTGARLSRGDLMHLALMSSENRAAYTLGLHYPGGVSAAVSAMNAKARALGMTHTRFADPTGLSAQNVSSPEDLAKLLTAASRSALIRSFSTDDRYSVLVGRRRLEFRNTDNLVAKADWNIVVQKTGYTNEAGRCLVMKAIIEDRPILIVLLDSFGKYTRTADARRVRDWIHARANERVEHAAR